MKIALSVLCVTSDKDRNLQRIINTIEKCADEDIDLVLFPEAALTGLINNDDPVHDLSLGITIPGNVTDILSKISDKRKIYVGLGVLEREGNKLFDSAILIAPDKDVIMKYRRVTPGWHGKEADLGVYCEGKEVKKVSTEFGTFSFLICGDLFDDNVISQVIKLKPDYILFPFARELPDRSWNRRKWEKEKLYYIERVKMLGIPTFMVNYIADESLKDDRSFGGAMVVLPSGKILAEMSIGRAGILNVEI